MRLLACFATLVVVPGQGRAEPEAWTVRSTGTTTIDAGLSVGFPTALPTGLSRGVGAGVAFGNCAVRWGARAAWATATESTMTWTVTQSDLRLRVAGSFDHAAGRGSFGIRLAAGGTLVHESRLRNQGERAGLTGEELATSTFAMLPAADLEGIISLQVRGPWVVVVGGGPSISVREGALHAGWIAQLGLGWRR